MSEELDPIEKLRIVAAMGSEVTLPSEAIRALLKHHNVATSYMAEGHAAYDRAKGIHRRGIRFQLAIFAFNLCILALVVFV